MSAVTGQTVTGQAVDDQRVTVRPAPHHGPRTRLLHGRWIDDWRPEDPSFWVARGARVARRNLLWSVVTEHVGFSIWSLWSVFVLFMGAGYGYTPAQKFLLTTVPTAVGAAMRLPYTVAVARFGGRNWTVMSGLLLIAPCAAAAFVMHPGTAFSSMLAVSALAGVGGGNFASSMANIDSYFPERLKGRALGLNAGGGNIGVAVVQLGGLAVLAGAGKEHPRILIGVYLPLIVVGAVVASWRMDNLTCVANDRRALRDACRERHTWIMSLLYMATFGSFIGFSFAFGQVLQVQFKHSFDTPIKAAYLTFLGPLIGSLTRPVGGWLADRLGGARVTLATFGAMGCGAAVVLGASVTRSLGLFVAGFVALFALSGVGNGSTYKMIPGLFAPAVPGDPALDREARRRSRALLGIAGALGAFGGVLVNLALRQAFLDYHTGNAAYVAFIGFYALCAVVTFLAYVRPAHTGRQAA